MHTHCNTTQSGFIPVWVRRFMAVLLGPSASIIKPSTLQPGNTAEKSDCFSQWWELSKPSGRGLVWGLWNRVWFPSPQGNFWKETLKRVSKVNNMEKSLIFIPYHFVIGCGVVFCKSCWKSMSIWVQALWDSPWCGYAGEDMAQILTAHASGSASSCRRLPCRHQPQERPAQWSVSSRSSLWKTTSESTRPKH